MYFEDNTQDDIFEKSFPLKYEEIWILLQDGLSDLDKKYLCKYLLQNWYLYLPCDIRKETRMRYKTLRVNPFTEQCKPEFNLDLTSF